MSHPSDQLEQVQHDDDALAAELRLCMVSGVGPRMRKTLLDRFGSAAKVFNAAPSELREVDGVGPKLLRALTAAQREIDVAKEIAYCRENQITLLLESNAAYPRVLKEIHDPPGVLFVRGEVRPTDAMAVAVVGTRHATAYGLAQAERLSTGLAHAGYTIVSGLARGIDAAAHSAAMKAGGRTLAVLGSGVMEIYPPEHEKLAQQVMENGAIISESHPLAPPLTGSFPQRNRIISGMSLGVIVVEASDRSGALITARLAMEQGREVFAVPGRVDNRNSRGCHRLIRDGAKLIETVDDVLEEFGPLVAAAPREDGREIRHPVELQLNEPETAVLTSIGSDPTSIDEVIAASKLEVPQVLSTISVLEMKRLIRRVSGNKVIRL
ncbi:MAG: DNA-processing protein DprA [Planctomycetales bacterium]|nr:DNA-processing protein DprA [Planctomycetales bacterium]